MMVRIAICGGIGSGKSAVTSILRDLGAKVVVADEINAALLCDSDYVREISNTFPTVVHNNVINKKELAEIIYRDEGQRRVLMAIAHPRIYERMFACYPDEEIVFYEIPLLSETPYSFDRVWFVNADLESRVRRIVARDAVEEGRARRIIALQEGESSLAADADVVIENMGDMSSLRERVKCEYYSILRQFS